MLRTAVSITVLLLLTTGSVLADAINECAQTSQHFYNTDAGCTETAAGIAWSTQRAGVYNYTEASLQCTAMSPAKTWRLPTLAEFRRAFGQLDGDASLEIPTNTPYWTANSADGVAVQYNPSTGARVEVPFSQKGTTVCVRNVHGCQKENQRFHGAAGGCQDVLSNLVWSVSSTKETIYEGATMTCKQLMQGNRRDWRLPSTDELKDITQTLDAVGFIPGLVEKKNYFSSYKSLAYPAISHYDLILGSPGKGLLRFYQHNSDPGPSALALCVHD